MVVAGAFLIFSLTATGPSPDLQKNTVVVSRGSVDMRITATGLIKPFNQVKVSPKYTGLLKHLLVEQGDNVKAGQLLALMDDSNLLGEVQAAKAAYLASKSNYEKMLHGNRPQEVAEAVASASKAHSAVNHAERALASSKAQVQSAVAQVERDETNAKRLTQLAAQGAVSDQDRLNAVTQAQVSRAQLDSAKAALQQAEAMLLQSTADLESAQQQLSLMRAGFRIEDVQTAHDNMVQADG